MLIDITFLGVIPRETDSCMAGIALD